MPKAPGPLAPALVPYPVRGLSRERAAQYVGVSASSFDTMVEEGVMPAPRIWHSRRIWDVRQIDVAFDDLPQQGQPKLTGWEDVKGWQR